MVEPDSERIFPFHFGGAFIEAWSEKWCRFGTAAFPFLFGGASLRRGFWHIWGGGGGQVSLPFGGAFIKAEKW